MDDEVLVGLLEALASDCDYTDGFEDAAPTVRLAVKRINELKKLETLRPV